MILCNLVGIGIIINNNSKNHEKSFACHAPVVSNSAVDHKVDDNRSCAYSSWSRPRILKSVLTLSFSSRPVNYFLVGTYLQMNQGRFCKLMWKFVIIIRL